MKRISFNRKGSRKRKSVIVLAAAAAVGLALVLGNGVAHGQDNASGPGAELPCTPMGQDGPPTIPEGTVIKVGGDYYQCLRGFWWKMPKAMSMDQPPVVSQPVVVAGRTPGLIASR